KALRTAKRGPRAAPPAHPAGAPALGAFRRNVDKLHRLRASGHALAEDQRRELRALRDAIDALLRE
ncbi:chromosome partitioning protein ParB, partial [Azospirillum brasilense]|nr:chromosome partitioning protein ParB [Azospirillum brasilense]